MALTFKEFNDKQIEKLQELLDGYQKLLKLWVEDVNNEFTEVGLCRAIKRLYLLDILPSKVTEKMSTDLFYNKPTKTHYSGFLLEPCWKGEGHWFELNESGYKQRIKFINQRIKDLTEQINTKQDGNK